MKNQEQQKNTISNVLFIVVILATILSVFFLFKIETNRLFPLFILIIIEVITAILLKMDIEFI